MKPYFVLDNMVAAAFDTAGHLFGLTFTARGDLPVYHPDVRVWEVRDRAGNHVGLFLHDNFARPGKHSGAWSSRYRDQQNLDGPVAPIVVNNNNFSKSDSAGGEPTLLSFDDAETLFHEFGHGLHSLLSRVRYPSQSGTAVRRDFVEFPSQVFEHWMSAPENLRKYARHYETGEPIPEALMGRLLAARTFNEGFATVEYTASALIDLELHRDPHPENLDPDRFEREFLKAYERPARNRPPPSPGAFPAFVRWRAAMPPGITPICGPRCWTPTGSPPSPRRATCSTRRWLAASRTSTAPATRATRWSCIALSAVATRT